jgi:2-methylcitrate dehydratase PrpD
MELEKKLVAYIAEARLERFPQQDVDIARYMVLTNLGTIVAGATAEGCQDLVGLVKEWGGKKEASILVHGGRVPAHHAVLANSTMARALDIDDAMIPGMHVGASSVPTALAAAELAGGCSGKDFLAAIATGQDVAARINLATAYEGSEPTWDASGVCGIFASTVAAGRILGLDASQMWNALGLTFTQPGGESMQAIVDGTLAVRLFQGCVSRNSMLCARLAKRGFSGPKNFLGGPWGYFHLYSKDKYDPDALVRDLGKRFELNNTVFKRYPSCGGTIASTDATLYLAREKGINSDNIARVDIKVLPYLFKLVGGQFKIGENPTVNAKFSIQYCVANALLRKDAKLRHFDGSEVRDPRIAELVKKIHVTADPKIDSGQIEFSLRTDMNVTTLKGEIFHKVVDIPRGFPGNPLSNQEHFERFEDAATYGERPIGDEKLEKILFMVRNLEEIKDVRSLIPLLSTQGLKVNTDSRWI